MSYDTVYAPLHLPRYVFAYLNDTVDTVQQSGLDSAISEVIYAAPSIAGVFVVCLAICGILLIVHYLDFGKRW
jgi:hypothetical protein